MKPENRSENHSLPFPSLSRDSVPCDPRLARSVISSYYGELAAISGYIYRSIITEPGCPALSAIFEKIAMDEMHHFRILGKLIRLLGGNPIIRTNLAISPINANEMCTPSGENIRCLISESIREEETALSEYKRLANCSMGTVSELFLRIATDEERHIRLLKEFCAK